MVEIRDIVDAESLREWLEGQPQRVSVVIAHRAAMLALPIYWNHMLSSKDMPPGSDLGIAPVLRACLLSGVGAYSPLAEVAPELYEATIQAAFRAPTGLTLTEISDDGEIVSRTSPTPVHPTVTSGKDSAYAAASSAAATSLREAAKCAVTASHATLYVLDAWEVSLAEYWKQVRLNCKLLLDGKDLSRTPVWVGGSLSIRDEWNAVKARLSKDEVDWSFWIKWYEAALSGRPLPWPLLERIALEVKGEDWKQGPKHVNGMIAEIEAGYLRDSTRLSERLLVDEHSGEVFAEPMEAKQPELIETHLNRIEDALTRALNNNNGLTEDSLETQILRDLVSKYSHDPERVEMDLVEVVGSLNGQIESDWLPDSPVINSLLNACKQGALDIRAMNPELAENRAIRARQAARELTVEDKAKLESGIEVIKPLLRADLREQFEGDLQRLLNDAIGPPPDGAPPLPAPDPAMRLANRVAKVSLMVQIDETVKKIKKHPLYGAGEVALHVAGLVALFYTIFSVII